MLQAFQLHGGKAVRPSEIGNALKLATKQIFKKKIV
jgi:hypothetical protein